MAGIFIEDGYTETKTLPAFGGVPEVVVVYRPALNSDKRVHQATLGSGERHAKADVELAAKFLVTINGDPPPDKKKLEKMHPNLLSQIVDLILGYTAADERDDAKN